MKKLFCFLLALLMIFGVILSVSADDTSDFWLFPGYKYDLKKVDVDLSSLDATLDESTVDEATGDEATRDEVYIKIGDCDNDGRVSVKDATTIQRYLVGNQYFAKRTCYLSADTDQNGTVNIKDATSIQKFCAEIDTPYTIGEMKKLDGKVRIFYDATWEPRYPLYCMCYLDKYGLGNELSEWPGEEIFYNETIGLYVIEVPEYVEYFLISNGYNHSRCNMAVPYEQDMVYYPVGMSDMY